MRYGMDDKLGNVAYEQERSTFLGVPGIGAQPRDHSEETAREIDCAVRKIVQSAFSRAVDILVQRRAELERGARTLLEKETLTEDDLKPFREKQPETAFA
jgi:cell division protease FtsH